jgi:uncharacterized membrane protein YciS (DUF1049 family)
MLSLLSVVFIIAVVGLIFTLAWSGIYWLYVGIANARLEHQRVLLRSKDYKGK